MKGLRPTGRFVLLCRECDSITAMYYDDQWGTILQPLVTVTYSTTLTERQETPEIIKKIKSEKTVRFSVESVTVYIFLIDNITFNELRQFKYFLAYWMLIKDNIVSCDYLDKIKKERSEEGSQHSFEETLIFKEVNLNVIPKRKMKNLIPGKSLIFFIPLNSHPSRLLQPAIGTRYSYFVFDSFFPWKSFIL